MDWIAWIESFLPEFSARRLLIVGTLILTPILLALRFISQRFVPVEGGQYLDKQSLRGQAWSLLNNISLALMNALFWVVILGGVYNTLAVADQQDWFWRLPPADETWMAGWPLILQSLVVIALLDFKKYWAHRLMHSRLGWPIHALHHSDRHMNFATGLRIHFLEGIFRSLCAVTILGWLNLPVIPVAMGGIFILWYSCYLHSELPWTHGPVRRLLASPDYHRWHHADIPEAYGKNLCLVFPVFDIVFGTYYDPGPCRTPIGVKGMRDDFISGQAYPFIVAGKWISARFSRPKSEGRI